MDFLKDKCTLKIKDNKGLIPIYKNILNHIEDKMMLDWLFGNQNQIELSKIFSISSNGKYIYSIDIYPPCIDTWIPYQIYLKYGYEYNHPIINYIGILDKETVLKSKFEKNIKKNIIIGLTEDKKQLEDFLKLEITSRTKIMIIYKLIMLGEDYNKYVNARNRREFVEYLENITDYKDDLNIIQLWHEIHKTKLCDIFTTLNDTQKKKFNYQPYLAEIISNLDKKDYQDIFDLIKVGIDYNKPIDKFCKKYAFTMVKNSPQLDYIIKNTDVNEVIKKGFTITPDNFDVFMKLVKTCQNHE